MSRPVLLASDSTCDLSEELYQKYPVRIFPFTVISDGKEYLDGVSITPDQIYATYKEKKILPHTAAINIAAYTDFFRGLTDEGYDVVYLTLGHGLSSSSNNCRLAAEEFEGHVFVVDTCNLSTGSGLLVIEAAERIAAGMDAATVAAQVQALASHAQASFVLNSLEFLYKGGRCSALSMLGANVLQLKPCIEVNNADGTMSVGKKYRGPIGKVREQYIRDQLARDDIDRRKIFLTHSGMDESQIPGLIRVIEEFGPFDNIYVTRAGCTISSHCGPETMGVLFLTK